MAALISMEAFGSDARPSESAIADVVSSGPIAERAFALDVLADIGCEDPKTILLVEKCLSDENENVRRAAAGVVAAVPAARTVGAIRKLRIGAARKSDIQFAFVGALGLVGDAARLDSEVIPTLFGLVHGAASEEVRKWAILGLAHLVRSGEPQAAILASALTDADAYTRTSVAGQMIRIGIDTTNAWDVLLKEIAASDGMSAASAVLSMDNAAMVPDRVIESLLARLSSAQSPGLQGSIANFFYKRPEITRKWAPRLAAALPSLKDGPASTTCMALALGRTRSEDDLRKGLGARAGDPKFGVVLCAIGAIVRGGFTDSDRDLLTAHAKSPQPEVRSEVALVLKDVGVTPGWVTEVLLELRCRDDDRGVRSAARGVMMTLYAR